MREAVIARSWLHFERRGDGTALVECRTELPLLVQRPLRAPGGGAIVPLLTPAAAFFDGDDVALDVTCGPGTDVTLVAAGATRLNRGRISLTLAARVADSATFRHLPHELIPFEDADYAQHVALELDLERGASALLLDVITPGRSAAPFSYRSLCIETSACAAGRLLVRERYTLTPAAKDALHGRTHYGSVLALGPAFDSAAADRAHECMESSAIFGSASMLPHGGIAVKALGYDARSLRAALLAAAGVTDDLGGTLPP